MTTDSPDTALLAKWLQAAKARAAPDPNLAGNQYQTGQYQTGMRADDCNQVMGGAFGIRIAADGTWFYHGSAITRKSLVRLFASVLYRDEAGDFWLVTPVEQGRIEVDDAPFTAVELDHRDAEQVLRFRTNIDEWVVLDADHPIRVTHNPATGEPRPYILVKGRLEALILRPVFYELVALGEARQVGGRLRLGVASCGTFFPLDDDLAPS